MQQQTNQLKRRLNLPLLSLYGLGTILGAGIYVLIGKIAGIAGIYAPIAFIVSAIIAAFTGLSYASLCSRYPKSAGEALYISQAFSIPSLSALVGWFVIATGVVSSATLVNGFVGYLSVFIQIPSGISITLVAVLITLVACWGILESVSIAAIITLIEVAGLVAVLFVLRGELYELPDQWEVLVPPVDADIWLAIMVGAFLAFYAFIGFEDMVNVVEEVIEPTRTMPLAILIALGLASLFYVLIAVVAVLSVPPEILSASSSPMVDLIQNSHPNLATAVGIISLIAIINGALVQVIMGSRMLYGMGCQGLAPTMFIKISSITQTPVIATLVIGSVIWLLALLFPLVTLAKITSFIIILVFALVNFSLVTICFRESALASFYMALKAAFLPLLAGILCLALLAAQLLV